jgi:hypothetical protein
MNDPTDTALAVCTGVGLALCAIGALVHAWRTSGRHMQVMKESRSDPDLENLAADSLPTHK